MIKDRIGVFKILFISGILSIIILVILSAFLAPIPAFRFAVESNINAIVRFYLILGVDPNGGYTFSPVYTAVKNNNIGLVKILLDSGIEIEDGTSLYIRALEKRNKKMAKTLFTCGVPFNSRYSPMIRFAIEANDSESIDRMILHGVPLDKAMESAIEHGNVFAIEKLKAAGAHPNLSYLTKNASMGIYKKLVELGEDKHRLFQKAVGYGNAEAVKYLLDEIGDDTDTNTDFYYQLAYSGIEHDQIEIG